MKRFLQNAGKVLLALCAAAFFSCSSGLNDLEEETIYESGDKNTVKVTISLNGSAITDRAALPGADAFDNSKFTLSAQSGTKKITLAENKSFTEITRGIYELTPARWTFIVNGFSKTTGSATFEGTSKIIDLTTSNNADISIMLKAASGGKGSVKVPVTYTAKGVENVKYLLTEDPTVNDAKAVPAPPGSFKDNGDGTYTVTYQNDAVDSGKTMYVKYFMYDEAGEICGTYIEALYVVAGEESTNTVYTPEEDEHGNVTYTASNKAEVPINLFDAEIHYEGDANKLTLKNEDTGKEYTLIKNADGDYDGVVPPGTYVLVADDEPLNVPVRVTPTETQQGGGLNLYPEAGDLLMNDGTYMKAQFIPDLTDKEKAKVIGVIFYAGKQNGVLGPEIIAVGIKNTVGEENGYVWARKTSDSDKAEGYDKNITDIQCSPSGTDAETATFTGSVDGHENLLSLEDEIDDFMDEEENPIEANYPAWCWSVLYGENQNISEMRFKYGWALPSLVEMTMLFRARNAVESSLSQINGDLLFDKSKNTFYWTSSQVAGTANAAWGLNVTAGQNDVSATLDSTKTKDSAQKVCAIRNCTEDNLQLGIPAKYNPDSGDDSGEGEEEGGQQTLRNCQTIFKTKDSNGSSEQEIDRHDSGYTFTITAQVNDYPTTYYGETMIGWVSTVDGKFYAIGDTYTVHLQKDILESRVIKINSDQMSKVDGAASSHMNGDKTYTFEATSKPIEREITYQYLDVYSYIPVTVDTMNKKVLFYLKGYTDSKKEDGTYERRIPLSGTNCENLFSALAWNVKSIDLSAFDTSHADSMREMFYWSNDTMGNKPILSEIKGLDTLDTGNVTNMYGMFCNTRITEADISKWNTGKVKDMSDMFRNCDKLENVNLTGLDTTKLKKMNGMFENCESLTEVNFTNFNTSNVTTMSDLFSCATSLVTVDISSFKKDSLTDEGFNHIFNECAKLKTIYATDDFDLTGFNTTTAGVFYKCYALVGGAGTEFDDNALFNDVKYAHIDGGSSNKGYFTLKTGGGSGESGQGGGGAEKNCNVLLRGKHSLASDIESSQGPYAMGESFEIPEQFDSSTPALEDGDKMLGWLDEDGNLYKVGDTYTVTKEEDTLTALLIKITRTEMDSLASQITADFDNAFEASSEAITDRSIYLDCYQNIPVKIDQVNKKVLFYLKNYTDSKNGAGKYVNKIPLTGTNCENLFGQLATKVSSIDLSAFDTSEATSMKGMFTSDADFLLLYQIKGLETLDTGNVTDMSAMFSKTNIQQIDISMWNTSKVTKMDNMFQTCGSLMSANLSGLDTGNLTNMKGMFGNCMELNDVNLTGWNTSKVENMSQLFTGNSGIREIDISSFTKNSLTEISAMFSGCTQLTTIYVSDSFDLSEINENQPGIFEGASNLTGGAGTKLSYISYNKQDQEWARVDGGLESETPGFFTSVEVDGYLGSKAPTVAYAVGDIVFNDGSSEPFAHTTQLTALQKRNAVAFIYNTAASNSGDSRTLGIAFDGEYCLWCTEDADALNLRVEALECTYRMDPSTDEYYFRYGVPVTTGGYSNGTNALELLAATEGVNDADNPEKYPAFYKAKNYKGLKGGLGPFTEGWYLPTLPELILLRQNLNVFDLASSAWGMVVGGSYIDFANNFLTATPNAECDDGGNYRFNYIMCPNNCSINYVEKDGDRAFGNAQPWGVAVPIRVFNQ